MTDEILERARSARRQAPPVGARSYLDYCDALLCELRMAWPGLREANAADRQAMRERGMPGSLVDRIRFGESELEAIGSLVRRVRGTLLAEAGAPRRQHRSGPLTVRRMARPLGLVLMIYEARPTVTVEGALLPVIRGNAVVLRGGGEIAATNRALAPVIRNALQAAGLPEHMVCVLDDVDRAQLRALLARDDAIDVLVPRGGPSLIDFCRMSSKIPVIASGGGANHLYVHESAPLVPAVEAILDSKLPEPTACNTLETVLCDAGLLESLVKSLVETATARREPCVLKVPGELAALGSTVVELRPLTSADRGREFLDRTVAVRPVSGPDEAVSYIRDHGSAHTEGIASADAEVIEDFCQRVDAAAIIVNGSLRLHDGPTLGLGPEISISTGRLHVRGPVDLNALTTYSWVVDARGALRARLDAQESE